MSDILSNLLYHYKFQDDLTNSGSIGSAGNLTLTGTMPYVTGKLGKGCTPSSTNYGNLANPPSLSSLSAWTISFWCYDTGYAINEAALSIGTNANAGSIIFYPYDTDTGNGIKIYANGTAATFNLESSPFKPAANSWQHVALVVRSASLAELYINGVLEATNTTNSHALAASLTHLRVGHYANAVQSYSGNLDDLRIYDRDLSAEDIADLFLAFTPGVLSESDHDESSVTVSWTAAADNNGAVTAQLQRGTSASGPWSNVSGSSPVTDSGLDEDTTYYYRVAFTDSVTTVYSNTLTVTTDYELLAAYTTPPDVFTDYEGWIRWKDRRIGQFERYCPSERATTLYFSNSQGDDTNGDGSVERPYQTRAKAIALEAAGTRGMRFRFMRGDEWDESTDWTPVNPRQTIDDYGDRSLADPLFNAFTEKYPASAALFTNASGNRWTAAETTDLAWVRLVEDRLGRPLIRAADATGCEATDDSFFWGSNVLHVNLGGDDPNDHDLEAVPSNLNNGVCLDRYGSRCENIRADGYGCHRTTTASQKQPFTNSSSGSDANFFKGCHGFYSGSHVLAHFLIAGSGGLSMWLRCGGGYPKYNSAGENIFNSYSQTGGAETYFLECNCLYGTLRSSDWSYATLKARAQGFYSHTTSGTQELMVMHRCRCAASHTPLSYLGSVQFTQTAATRGDVHSFRVDCRFDEPDEAIDQFPSEIFVSNAIVYGEIYHLKPLSNNPGATLGTAVSNCWFANSAIIGDAAAVTEQWALVNRSSGNYSIHAWHVDFLISNSPFDQGFDYDVIFGTTAGTGPAQDSSMVNCIVAFETSGTTNAYLAFTNVAFNGTKGIDSNCYLADQSTNNERGFNNDANAVVLTSMPDLNTPIPDALNSGNTDIPRFSHDLYGKPRSQSVAPDRGAVDFSSPWPQNASAASAAGSAAAHSPTNSQLAIRR